MGCDKEDNSVYNAKIKELECLIDRYQKLSNWIDKVVEFDFKNPSVEINQLNLDKI